MQYSWAPQNAPLRFTHWTVLSTVATRGHRPSKSARQIRVHWSWSNSVTRAAQCGPSPSESRGDAQRVLITLSLPPGRWLSWRQALTIISRVLSCGECSGTVAPTCAMSVGGVRLTITESDRVFVTQILPPPAVIALKVRGNSSCFVVH